MMPKRIKKQKKIVIMNNGIEEDSGWEEYYDYIFPDDEIAIRKMKILDVAKKWKEAQKKMKI